MFGFAKTIVTEMQRPISRNAGSPSPENEENPLAGLEAFLSCLWIWTPLSATFSLTLIAVGMVTNQWLHTTEKMPNPAYNGTGEKDYLSKLTVSGLWVFCFTNRKYPIKISILLVVIKRNHIHTNSRY